MTQPFTPPTGFVLVPVEPTTAMVDAADDANDDGATYAQVYSAMLAAAPQPTPASAPAADDVSDAIPKEATFLQEQDQHDLHRFIETTEDDEGYDIGKDTISRLAELGVVRNCGFGRYSVTAFGYWAHERHWEQRPSLPLQTNVDRDAKQRAAMQADAGKESR